MKKFLKNLGFTNYIVVLLLVGSFVLILSDTFYLEPQRIANIKNKKKETCTLFCKNKKSVMRMYDNKVCYCSDESKNLFCYSSKDYTYYSKVLYYILPEDTKNSIDSLR